MSFAVSGCSNDREIEELNERIKELESQQENTEDNTDKTTEVMSTESKNDSNLSSSSKSSSTVEKNDNTEINESNPSVKNVAVNVEILNVRASSSTESEILGKVYQNELFEVKKTKIDSENQEWYMIDYNGSEAWIAGWFCIDADQISNNEKTASRTRVNQDIKVAPVVTSISGYKGSTCSYQYNT